jgi:hypothetical protein
MGVRDAVALGAAWGMTCARVRDGTILCWGGRYDDGPPHEVTEPTPIGKLE